MTNLKLYSKMLRIITFDGDAYFLPASERRGFEAQLETRKFVKLGGEEGDTIATRDIKSIKPHLSMGYEDLPKSERTKVEAMIKSYYLTLGYYPKQESIAKMTKRVLSREV